MVTPDIGSHKENGGRLAGGGSCPVCKTYQGVGSFCRHHGAALTEITCPSCGTEVLKLDKFCVQCGGRL